MVFFQVFLICLTLGEDELFGPNFIKTTQFSPIKSIINPFLLSTLLINKNQIRNDLKKLFRFDFGFKLFRFHFREKKILEL